MTELFRLHVRLAMGCLILAACSAAAGTNQSALAASPQHAALLKAIDGRTNDWAEGPIWDRGAAGLLDPGFSIDVRQVYMANDRNNLYVFIRFPTSIAERFKQQSLGGHIGDLYFDVDNDASTGSTEADLGSFGYGNGYESRIVMDCAVIAPTNAPRLPVVSYDVQRLDRPAVQRELDLLASGTNAWTTVMRQIVRRVCLWSTVPESSRVSSDGSGLIAHGDDGVELVVPMAALGIVPGSCIRIMLEEDARDYGMEGYGVRFHTFQ